MVGVGRGELTDKAWAQIQPLLPAGGRPGGRWSDHRMVINGILWKLRTGAPAGPPQRRPGPLAMTAMCAGVATAPGRLLAHAQTKSDAVGEVEWVEVWTPA